MSFPPSDNGRQPSSAAPANADEPRLLTRAHLPTAPLRSPYDDSPGPASTLRLRAFLALLFPPQPSSPATPRKSKPYIRRTLQGLLALCVLLLIAAAVFTLSMRRDMRASLPQIDGDLHVSGLARPVEVARNAQGVPSIQAASLDDLLFAQGFVTAQDRLWQMDVLRRHGSGTLAELLGSSLVAHDRMQRVLRLRATAELAVTTLPAGQHAQLAAYARGVNAFLAANADNLPVEFHLLHYTPAPWTPADSLVVAYVMAQDLSTEFPTKLLRESFSAHLAPQLLADLYPVGSWRDRPPGAETPDLTSARPAIEQVPLDETQSRLRRAPSATPRDLLAVRDALGTTCRDCRSGSNNWAVAGARSASGRPLVSNDMHLALGIPAIWYEASLHCTGTSLNVTGLTLPGVPFVLAGRNAHVAWGYTSLGGDVQDVYIEHLRGPQDNQQFQRADGSWTALHHHPETIRVRGGRDVRFDLIATTHSIGNTLIETPIITPLYPSEHRTLSLAWSVYDITGNQLPFLAVDSAPTGAALAEAFRDFNAPSLNVIYADDANHIGYHAIGRIPIRGAAVHHPLVANPADPTAPSLPLTTSPAPDEESAVAPRPRATPVVFAVSPRRRNAARQTAPTPSSAPPDAPIPPPAAVPDFTIGSAIPTIPVDALSADAQWSGYIPFDDLPIALDPVNGVLTTANARITPDHYPYAVAVDWAPAYRVDRILRTLIAQTGLTPADMLRLQMDVHSELDLALAQRFAYALDQTAADTAHPARDATRLHEAADILRRWNGNVDPDAPAAALVAATRSELWQILLTAQIAAHDGPSAKSRPDALMHLYAWEESSFALEELVAHTPARWLAPGFHDWNAMLTAAVARGLANAHAPAHLDTWSYSKTHPVEIKHPILSADIVQSLLGVRTGSGLRIVGGDTSTVKATSRSFGPSERFTADLGDDSQAFLNLPAGQSGVPLSAWYLDQLPAWLDGNTFSVALEHARTAHTLVLRP